MKVLAQGLVALAMCATSSAFMLAPSPVSIQRSRTAGISFNTGTRGGVRWLLLALRRTPLTLVRASLLRACFILFASSHMFSCCAQEKSDYLCLALSPSVTNTPVNLKPAVSLLSLGALPRTHVEHSCSHSRANDVLFYLDTLPAALVLVRGSLSLFAFWRSICHPRELFLLPVRGVGLVCMGASRVP